MGKERLFGNGKILGGVVVYYAESEGISSTTSTSFQNKISLSLPSGSYIVWGHFTVGGLTSQSRFGTLSIDIGEFNTVNAIWHSTTVTKYASISPGQTLYIRYRTLNAGNTAYIKWARIVALQLNSYSLPVSLLIGGSSKSIEDYEKERIKEKTL